MISLKISYIHGGLNIYSIPNFIYFCGIDGSGKTTLAEHLIDILKSKNIKTKYIWLRSNPFFTVPILIYGRIIGLTVYETVNNVKIGHHNFSKSKMIKNAYPILLFMDMSLAKLIKINLLTTFGYFIICDRYIIDSIVDMAIDLNLNKAEIVRTCNLFSKLLPKNNKIMLIETDLETIYSRRITLKFDDTLEMRHNLYSCICKNYNVCKISNNASIDRSLTDIYDCVGVDK